MKNETKPNSNTHTQKHSIVSTNPIIVLLRGRKRDGDGEETARKKNGINSNSISRRVSC